MLSDFLYCHSRLSTCYRYICNKYFFFIKNARIIVFINVYDRNILQLIWNWNTRINLKEYVFTHFVFVLQVPISKRAIICSTSF